MPMRGHGTPRGAVLVGFMGAGKSSGGKEVARRLGGEFVDVDDRIEADTGKRIPEIFSSEGEQAFRERERKAIRDAVSVPGRGMEAECRVDTENLPPDRVAGKVLHLLARGTKGGPSGERAGKERRGG